jgi:hypothetical protein
VAAKHDGKVARQNMWVTKQNLARSKGGWQGHPFQGRKPRAPATVATPAPLPSASPGGAREKPDAAPTASPEDDGDKG